MLAYLNEINRVLVALRNLCLHRKRVPRSVLLDYLREEAVMARSLEPELAALAQLDLIAITTAGVAMTDLGRELLRQNTRGVYELQPSQCQLIVRKCYSDGALRGTMKQFARKLSTEASTGEISWSPIDSEPLGELHWVADHLLQLGVLLEQGDTLMVAPGYVRSVSEFLDEGGDFNDYQLELYLREKRLLGDIAECFVLHFERERLKAAGCDLESACVQRISNVRVNAGFDVKSFDAASADLTHDRFIEVKGSGNAGVRFVWSQNEMQKAQIFGHKYWIYFIGEIDRRTRTVKRQPVMLHNPYNRLQSDERFRMQPGNMIVTANFAGARLSPGVKVRR